MSSLSQLLPLFDTGSGSTYDLRHYTMGDATPPRLARWDYHSTHVNQLLALSTVPDMEEKVTEVLSKTAERWRGYMAGRRAEHN